MHQVDSHQQERVIKYLTKSLKIVTAEKNVFVKYQFRKLIEGLISVEKEKYTSMIYERLPSKEGLTFEHKTWMCFIRDHKKECSEQRIV